MIAGESARRAACQAGPMPVRMAASRSRSNAIGSYGTELMADETEPAAGVGAMPLLDVPGVEGVVLRQRAWDAQHWFDVFLETLLADEPLNDVLGALARSIAESLEAQAAAVFYGYAGDGFAGVGGWAVDTDLLARSE